eukprot:TRINITY_DN2897_c0_g1_i1.p1 TRINITY_DN2897_c0_g1~~TRINITY_DN2897_c0_g1_i1.p1  ORF type:complete len:97 (+),score=9.26 TRINITY_DN2897_c0_g1_i1:179-469(+)
MVIDQGSRTIVFPGNKGVTVPAIYMKSHLDGYFLIPITWMVMEARNMQAKLTKLIGRVNPDPLTFISGSKLSTLTQFEIPLGITKWADEFLIDKIN